MLSTQTNPRIISPGRYYDIYTTYSHTPNTTIHCNWVWNPENRTETTKCNSTDFSHSWSDGAPYSGEFRLIFSWVYNPND